MRHSTMTKISQLENVVCFLSSHLCSHFALNVLFFLSCKSTNFFPYTCIYLDEALISLSVYRSICVSVFVSVCFPKSNFMVSEQTCVYLRVCLCVCLQLSFRGCLVKDVMKRLPYEWMQRQKINSEAQILLNLHFTETF